MRANHVQGETVDDDGPALGLAQLLGDFWRHLRPYRGKLWVLLLLLLLDAGLTAALPLGIKLLVDEGWAKDLHGDLRAFEGRVARAGADQVKGMFWTALGLLWLAMIIAALALSSGHGHGNDGAVGTLAIIAWIGGVATSASGPSAVSNTPEGR